MFEEVQGFLAFSEVGVKEGVTKGVFCSSRVRSGLLQPRPPIVGAVVVERVAVDDFDGAHRAGNAPGQPDLAVTAPADQAEEFVVGNVGR